MSSGFLLVCGRLSVHLVGGWLVGGWWPMVGWSVGRWSVVGGFNNKRRVLLLIQMNLYYLCLYIISCYLDMNETVYEEYLRHNESLFRKELYDYLCEATPTQLQPYSQDCRKDLESMVFGEWEFLHKRIQKEDMFSLIWLQT